MQKETLMIADEEGAHGNSHLITCLMEDKAPVISVSLTAKLHCAGECTYTVHTAPSPLDSHSPIKSNHFHLHKLRGVLRDLSTASLHSRPANACQTCKFVSLCVCMCHRAFENVCPSPIN